MSEDTLVTIPENHLLRLLSAAGTRKANKSGQTYKIDQSHLFTLLGECAKKHKCKSINDAHCVCARAAKDA